MSLWSCARFNLGLSDEEFYALTPRQFTAVLQRHREEIQHRELLAGIVASTVANFSYGAAMGGLKEAIPPSKFMPSRVKPKGSKKAPQRERMTRKRRDQVATVVRAYFQALANRK